MPYITQENRIKFDEILEKMPDIFIKGELEYCIYYLMTKYMQTHTYDYSNLHDIVYAAHHCGDEFRRRYLDGREDFALSKNGDIYPKEEDIGN